MRTFLALSTGVLAGTIIGSIGMVVILMLVPEARDVLDAGTKEI